MATNPILYDLNEALQRIAFEAKRVIQFIMETEKGINEKIGTNTLIDSDIYNELDIDIHDTSIIDILVNSYIDAIESGRKPYEKRVPINALIEWGNKKGIPLSNGIVYAIQDSIYKNGIKPRPIMIYVFNEWNKMWDDWAEELINEILADLTDFFNN